MKLTTTATSLIFLTTLFINRAHAQVSVPLPPDNFSAKIISNSQIVLQWRDNSEGEKGFLLEEEHNGAWAEVTRCTNNSVAFQRNGLKFGTYKYRVCAFNDAGFSKYSNETQVLLRRESGSKWLKYISENSFIWNINKLDKNKLIIVGRKQKHGWIASLEEDGTILWEKQIGSRNSFWDRIRNCELVSDTLVVLSGSVGAKPSIMLFNTAKRTEVFSRTYDKKAYFTFTVLASDGSIFTGGMEESKSLGGSETAFILKLDPQGRLLWEKNLGAVNVMNGVALQTHGIVLSGFKRDFGFTSGWISRLDDAGQKTWEKNLSPSAGAGGYGGQCYYSFIALNEKSGFLVASGINSYSLSQGSFVSGPFCICLGLSDAKELWRYQERAMEGGYANSAIIDEVGDVILAIDLTGRGVGLITIDPSAKSSLSRIYTFNESVANKQSNPRIMISSAGQLLLFGTEESDAKGKSFVCLIDK